MTYRKIPGVNTYTAEQPEKEQEVIPAVTSIAVPNPEGDKLTSLDHVDVQPDSESRGIKVPVSLSYTPTSHLFSRSENILYSCSVVFSQIKYQFQSKKGRQH